MAHFDIHLIRRKARQTKAEKLPKKGRQGKTMPRLLFHTESVWGHELKGAYSVRAAGTFAEGTISQGKEGRSAERNTNVQKEKEEEGAGGWRNSRCGG